jgi:glycopeptide antibiotics resistance protein
MQGIIFIILVVSSWSLVWLVPSAMAGRRRRNKKKAYWSLLFMALSIELILSVASLQLSTLLELTTIGVIISPVFGSFAGGYFYWRITEYKDKIQPITHATRTR